MKQDEGGGSVLSDGQAKVIACKNTYQKESSHPLFQRKLTD